jgi:WD40 repeat protein
MSVDYARIKCTFGLPPNEDHHVIKLARDASHEQLYQSIAEEYGQPLVVYKYLDSEGSPITVREGSRLDLAELLEDIPAKQYLRLFVREPQKIIEPKSPVFSAVKKTFAGGSSFESEKVLSASLDESSEEQDSAPRTPEPEITWLDKTHVENGSAAVKQPPKFLGRAPPKINTNFNNTMVFNPEERVDRTPQEPRPQSPFDDPPSAVDINGPEKTPPPSPRILQPDLLPTFSFDKVETEEKKRKPRASKGAKGERERRDSRSRDKKGRSGSEHKVRKERKSRTPHGTDSPGKVSYEKLRRKTDGEDTHGAGEVVSRILERDKLTTPIVDVNNGEVKKEVENFNAKNFGDNQANNNFNKVFVPNPALENGPPTPKNLVNSMSSNGSMASQSTEAPASPMIDSAPPTPVSDLPALQESFHWRKGELIGSGAFGRVYKGLLDNGEFIAVKELDLPDYVDAKTEMQYRSFKQEEELLKSLQHPNIVKFLGSQTEKNKIYVFLELVEGGSISSIIAKYGGGLGEQLTRVYARQILMGLDYLHSNKIIHRDIKGANILVNTKGVVKVADFGASKTLQGVVSRDNLAKSMSGTPYFMAPEVFKSEGYSTPADVWSFGCTVLEMVTGVIPWSREFTDFGPFIYALTNTERVPAIPDQSTPELKDFIRLCLTRNPRDRPSASTLLRHPWLAQPVITAPVPAASLPSALRTTVEPSLLPREVALHIFSFLEIKDIVHCLKTCAHWHAVGQDNYLWRKVCLSRWNKLQKLRHSEDPKLAEKDSLEKFQMKLSGTTMMTTIELEQLDNDTVEKGRWKKFYRGLLEYDRKWIQCDLKQAMLFKGHNKQTNCVLLHQKGKKLISGSEDKKIKVWDLGNLRNSKRATKPVSHSFKGHTSAVQCFALMPGERRLFSGSADKTIRVWDLESRSRKCSRVYEGHEHTVTSLCAPFATDTVLSNHVISGSLDGNVKIWDIERGTSVVTLKGHKRGISAVKVTENFVISAGLDNVLKLWDSRTNQCTATLEGHQDEITCFDSIGHVIISASKDGVIREWNIRGAGVEWPGLYIDNKPVAKDRIVALKFDALANVMTLSNTVNDFAALRVWNYNSEKCHTEVTIKQIGIDMDLNLHHLDLSMLHSTLLVHDLGAKSTDYIMASCGADIRLWSLVAPINSADQ